jgi:hypothetical protein
MTVSVTKVRVDTITKVKVKMRMATTKAVTRTKFL